MLEDARAGGERHLYLIRHTEARKNLEGRQGGQGTDLTPAGKIQASWLGAYLDRQETGEGHRVVVYSHSTPQVRQTADAIARMLGCAMEEDERLRGLCLGRLAGLTLEEGQAIDPAAVSRLDDWARGRLRIDHLNLPGSEDLGEFRQRVTTCLDRIKSSCENACAVIVATRSTLIMLQNLLTLGAAFSYRHYRAYSYSNGAVRRWTFIGESATPDLSPFRTPQFGGRR